jgi:hypothetical protein
MTTHGQMTFALNGAEGVLAHFEARLRSEARLIGLTLWTGALRRWHEVIRARQAEAYGQLMLLEHEVECDAGKGTLLATIARAKGILVGVMVGLIAWQMFAGEQDLFLRTARRSGRRRDDAEVAS